jgi:uncharacterized membrane protein YjfL (UPF0719 family)
MVDAFCPECFRPLDELPSQSGSDNSASELRWTRRLALGGALLGLCSALVRLSSAAGTGPAYVIGYLAGGVVIMAVIFGCIGLVIDKMQASQESREKTSN